MGRWKSRGGKSQRREEKRREETRREEKRREEKKRRDETRRDETRRDETRREEKRREEKSRERLCFSNDLWPRRVEKRLAKAAGAEPCGQMRFRTSARRCGAKHIWKSKCTKHLRSEHFWKLRCRKSAHRCGAKHIWDTSASDHFWKSRCRKSARHCGAKQVSKSKCTKHLSFGALLEVAMSKKCTPLWCEAHFQVKMLKTSHGRTTFEGSDVFLRGRRKGCCTLPKVSKKWGVCGIFKNDGRSGTFEEDLQRCMSRGRRSARDMFIREVRSGRWFPERRSGRSTLHSLHHTAPQLQLQLHYTNYTTLQLQRQLQLHYTTLHPAVVGEVTTASIATTPKNTTPTTFRSISVLALPSVIYNRQPLL